MKNCYDADLILEDIQKTAQTNLKVVKGFEKIWREIPINMRKTAIQMMRKRLENDESYFRDSKELFRDILNQLEIGSVKIQKQRKKFQQEIQEYMQWAKHKQEQNNTQMQKQENSLSNQRFSSSNQSQSLIVYEQKQEQQQKDF